jgi:peptidyl-prolyl cis-trans isomerase D
VNKIWSAFGGVLVIAIAVIFIFQFGPQGGMGKAKDSGPTCVAEVHGTCLSAGSFWAGYRLIAGNVEPSRLRAMNLRRRVADGLVEQWLLNQDAKRLGITVSDDDVLAELARGRAHVSIPAADLPQLGEGLLPLRVKNPKTKKFDTKVYEKEVRTRTRLSPVEFREYQKAELIAARMRDLVRTRVRVGENEAREQFSREKSTATLDYARFDRRFFADVVVDASQKNVDAWAEKAKEELDKIWESRKNQVLPECRVVREIFVRRDEMGNDEEKAAARKRIDRALERIRGGEDFADVARAVSDDPSAVRGGEIGCLLKGKAPKPFEEAVGALGAGKVSEVISTEPGFFVVKVEQIAKDAEAEKLGRAYVAREMYVGQEAERLAVEAAKNVLAAVKGGKSLKDALQTYTDELAKSREPAADPKADKKKDEKADEKKKKKKGDDSDHPPQTVLNHPLRPTIETTLPFNVSGDPIPGVRQSTDITKIAFELAKPGDAPGDVIPLENGYVAVQLKEKTPASKEQWDKDREFYVAAMRKAKADDALTAYVKRLHGQLAGDAKFTADLVNEPKEGQGQGPSGPSGPPEEDPFGD